MLLYLVRRQRVICMLIGFEVMEGADQDKETGDDQKNAVRESSDRFEPRKPKGVELIALLFGFHQRVEGKLERHGMQNHMEPILKQIKVEVVDAQKKGHDNHDAHHCEKIAELD